MNIAILSQFKEILNEWEPVETPSFFVWNLETLEFDRYFNLITRLESLGLSSSRKLEIGEKRLSFTIDLELQDFLPQIDEFSTTDTNGKVEVVSNEDGHKKV
ncbi:MAG: hypothetical protein ACFFC7_35110, partial [Candidatus Hermodarchaeota archaeon]